MQAPVAEKIILQANKLRRPIPDAIRNKPQLWPWLELYYRAFHDLKWDRHYPFGFIPWTARQRWAESYSLSDAQTERLHAYIRALDIAYLQHLRDNTPSPGGSGDSRNVGVGQPRFVRK